MIEWKEIGAPTESAVYELYDYLTDPQETENQAGKKFEALAQMKIILKSHPEAKPPVEQQRPARAAK
jgi:iduronate 2-sulfatase